MIAASNKGSPMIDSLGPHVGGGFQTSVAPRTVHDPSLTETTVETIAMKRRSSSRRRPDIEITMGRAARLRRLVLLLAQDPRGREEVLHELGIGLRTFYRELEFLKKHGIKVTRRDKAYTLLTTAEQADGRLPFPDPQLSFAEVKELSRCPGEAGHRLAELLASVIRYPETTARGPQCRS